MNRQKILRFLLHLLFWVFIVVFFTFIYGVRDGNYFEIFQILLGTLPLDIMYTYFLIYALIPVFLLKKRYIWFVVLFITTFTLMVILEWTINYFFLYPSIYSDYEKWKDSIHYFSGAALMLYVSLGFVILLASAIKLVRFWMQSQQARADLEIQHRKSELAMLRSQVNPHFLFNTLNNIDALIWKDPQRASETLVKLSDMMRYFIYEATTEKVPLEKEIDYLNCFIELQRIRHKDPDSIRLSITGASDGIQIAPMLLIPFVENAFKHGVTGKHNPSISVELTVNPKEIRFDVLNYLSTRTDTVKDPGRGIGLANVRRRLSLVYPDKHRLSTVQAEDQYKVTLVISHV